MDNVIAFQRRYLEEHGDKLDKIEQHAQHDKIIQAAQLFATYKDLKDSDKLVNQVEALNVDTKEGLLNTTGDGLNANVIKLTDTLRAFLMGRRAPASDSTPISLPPPGIAPTPIAPNPIDTNSTPAKVGGFFKRTIQDAIEYVKVNSTFESMVNPNSKGLFGFLINKQLERRANPKTAALSSPIIPTSQMFGPPLGGGSTELEEENVRLMMEQNEAIRNIDEQTKPIPEVLDILKNGPRTPDESVGESKGGILGSILGLFTGFGASLAASFSTILSHITGFGAAIATATSRLLGRAGAAIASGTRAAGSILKRGGSATASAGKKAWDVLRGSGAIRAGTSILGKLALPLTLGMAAYDGVSGYQNAESNLGITGRAATFGEKLSSGAGSILSGLSFGLLDEKGSSASIAKFLGAGPEPKVEVNGTASKSEFIDYYVSQRAGDNSVEGKTPDQAKRIVQLRSEAEKIWDDEMRLQREEAMQPKPISNFFQSDPITYQQYIEFKEKRSAEILESLERDAPTIINPTLKEEVHQSLKAQAMHQASVEAAAKFNGDVKSSSSLLPVSQPMRTPPTSGDHLYQRSSEIEFVKTAPTAPANVTPTVISAPTSVTNNTSISTSKFPRNPDSSYQNYSMRRFRPDY